MADSLKFKPPHDGMYKAIPLEFKIELIGEGSSITMNGQELPNVRDIKIHQPLDGWPTVTVEFLATRVTGSGHG